MATYYSLLDNTDNSEEFSVRITKERIVKNITSQKSVVLELVDICNRMEVDYEQFDDVLENYMADFKTF